MNISVATYQQKYVISEIKIFAYLVFFVLYNFAILNVYYLNETKFKGIEISDDIHDIHNKITNVEFFKLFQLKLSLMSFESTLM